MDDRREQREKAFDLIAVTVFGISITFKAQHPAKAFSPTDIKLFGNVIDDNVSQSRKALSPMAVTPSGIMIEVTVSLSPSYVYSLASSIICLSVNNKDLSYT